MPHKNLFQHLLNISTSRSNLSTTRLPHGEKDQLHVESLEPRMMLNGDASEVLFQAGFEDANVGAGQFDFFRNVSGFTAAQGRVEVQNSHPAVGPAAQGGKLLELDGNNEIYVDIRDVQAASLTLDLQYSPRGGADLRENAIAVIWNGEVVETLEADGTGSRTTQFRRVSVDLPIEEGSTGGRLEFRSVFSGGRGLGGLLDDIRVTAELGPLVIQNVVNQDVNVDSEIEIDLEFLPPNSASDDVEFEIVRAPVGATIDPNTGLFRWQATDNNVADTLDRETSTVVSQPTSILFADFEDVNVGRGQFDFFSELSGFAATGRRVEVQHNHPAVGPASTGNQHVELDGRNGIARDVATNADDLYELTFDFSPRAGADAATNAIEVLWDGVVVHTVTADGRQNRSTNYGEVTVQLPVETGGTKSLEFRSQNPGTGGLGGLIDNVRVTRQTVSVVTSNQPYQVLVRATDSNGRSDTERFNISIVDESPDSDTPPDMPADTDTPPTTETLLSTVTVRADYRNDFQAGIPAANWQYLWNAPDDWNGTSSSDSSTGEIGDPENYVPLLASGSNYTPTGTDTPNNAPANFLNFNSNGGHPGAGQFELNTGNATDRYAITAWTVTESGFYAIADSFITTPNPNGDGQVNVLVHVNDNEALIRTSSTGTPQNFDTNLGFLEVGDVIYVAFGPEGAQSFDSFQQNFSIVQLTGADFSVLVEEGEAEVSESGEQDSFQVVLHQQPTEDVVIQLTNSSPEEVRLSAQTLTFTPENWNSAQTVTLTAVDDDVEDGFTSATISAEVISDISAAEYRDVDNQLISVVIQDDETLLSLQAQIDQGLEAGLEEIVLTPGVYESVSPTTLTPHLSITGAEDVSIVAEGVTLVATTLNSAVRIQHSENVTLTGLTIDYDRLPFTQGTIIGVAADGSSFDVRIHDGYDVLPDGESTRAIIHDATSRLVKPDTFSRFGSSVTALEDERVIRIGDQFLASDSLATGDLVSLTRSVLSPHALIIDQSNSIRLEEVTVNASTAFAFFETESSGNEYYDLRVTPGDTPESATEARLLSSSFDAFHSKYAEVGPKIVGAQFDSTGDDGIAINGDYGLVVSSDEATNSVLIASKLQDPHIDVGDQLRFGSKDSDVVYERTVVAIERYDVGDVDFDAIGDIYFDSLSRPEGQFDLGYVITLSDSVPVVEGDLVSNLSRTGSGYEITDSVISNTRARGLVLKASDGIVSGNTISNVAQAGILISPEAAFWAEAGFSSSLIIDNNRIVDVGFVASSQARNNVGGILIGADPDFSTRGHQDIQISNNELDSVTGINLSVTNALDVEVFGNRFINVQPFERDHGSNLGFDSGSLVWLDNVNNVSFESNFVDSLSPNTDQLFFRSSTATNVTGLDTGLSVGAVLV